MKFLIEKGNFSPMDKETRLYLATGFFGLVRKCLKEGDDPKFKNSRDQTPYDIAKNGFGKDKNKNSITS